jgi:hypothetical protein
MVSRFATLAASAARMLCAVVAAAAVQVHAQDAVLQASVDRAAVRDNESFTYTIRAEGSVRGEPEMGPVTQQFDVLGSSSEKRIGIINGRTSQVTTWTYQLMPKSAGEFTLPPVRVDTHQTNPVTVRVTAPDTSSSAPSDIFMELDAQPSTAYAQSQVIFTLRLFVGVATGRATLTQPDVTGGEAIVEKLGEDTQYQTERGGRNFLVRERRYAIFPQAAGTLTIGPATFEAMVIPDRGFSRVQRFRSGSLDVAVQPAVPPPPELAGAAWLPARRVALRERWNDDSSELPVGIPRTRELTIEADGVLETQLPDVTLTQLPGIRQYADQPELVRELAPDGFKAQRRVAMAVIAQTPGDVTLPRIELPWFNVVTRSWEVASLPERTLRVTPSSEMPPASPPAEATTSAAPAAAPSGNLWPGLSAALGLGWLATGLLWWRSARSPRATAAAAAANRGAAHAQRSSERKPSERKLLRSAQAACAASDADAARRALLEWAEARFPAAPPRSLGALASELAGDVAQETLDLEAHIYGAAPEPWDGRALSRALAELDAARGSGNPEQEEPLLPLYR